MLPDTVLLHKSWSAHAGRVPEQLCVLDFRTRAVTKGPASVKGPQTSEEFDQQLSPDSSSLLLQKDDATFCVLQLPTLKEVESSLHQTYIQPTQRSPRLQEPKLFSLNSPSPVSNGTSGACCDEQSMAACGHLPSSGRLQNLDIDRVLNAASDGTLLAIINDGPDEITYPTSALQLLAAPSGHSIMSTRLTGRQVFASLSHNAFILPKYRMSASSPQSGPQTYQRDEQEARGAQRDAGLSSYQC
ncbi:hypothetical protein WJX74_005825 [Apatococcus lobatus]|uniref:Uncharacterized protein n=1 Tax=Apatococcus lobatus TaxID=904363 RepID=A0AAW1RZ79_9CHLO